MKDGKLDIDIIHLDGERVRIFLYGENGNDDYDIERVKSVIKGKISKDLEKGIYYIRVRSSSGYGGYELNLNFK